MSATTSTYTTINIFANNTVIYAKEINDNFCYLARVGVGLVNPTWLPMGGANLDFTTSIYDLGSANYRWGNIYYTGRLQIYSTTSHMWYMFSDTVLSTTAQQITIPSLNSDEYELYMIQGIIKTNVTSSITYYMSLNGITTSTYYMGSMSWDGATSTSEAIATLSSYILGTIKTAGASCFFSAILFSQTDTRKGLIIKSCDNVSFNNIDRMQISGQVLDSVDTITSILFYSNYNSTTAFATGTSIQIWRSHPISISDRLQTTYIIDESSNYLIDEMGNYIIGLT